MASASTDGPPADGKNGEKTMDDMAKLMSGFQMDSGDEGKSDVSIAKQKSDQITSKPLTEPELAMLNALRGSGPVRELGLHGELELSFLARLHVSVGHTAEMDVESNAARDVIRCLYARKFELDRAEALFKNCTALLTEHGVHETRRFTLTSAHRDEIATGKMFKSEQKDPHGRPIFWFCGGKHVAKQFPIQSTQAVFLALMDNSLEADAVGARDGITFVVDFVNYGWSNIDWEGEEMAGKTMQDHMACRLRQAYLLNSPWWFRAVMAIVGLFMKEKFMNKWRVVGSVEELAEHLGGADRIPRQQGGTWELDLGRYADEFVAKANATK